MKSARSIMAGACALSRIKPPGPSFADYRRWIDDCIEAGVVVVEADKQGRAVRYSGVFAQAIAKRVAWLQDALQRGIPYSEASDAFDAACDRESAQARGAMERRDRNVADTAAEYAAERRAKKRRERRPADGYQPDAEMQTFADEVGL